MSRNFFWIILPFLLGILLFSSCKRDKVLIEPKVLYQHMTFSETDVHEAYLTYFDNLGVEVFLTAESGDADVMELMDLIILRYGHHPCVAGFAIDVEWRTTNPQRKGYGTKVTDAEAEGWETHLKTRFQNSQRQLVLKHWDSEWMPPTYRGDIIFINDAQYMGNVENFNSYFTEWADRYSPNTVMFQVGYNSDHHWWKQLGNPLNHLGGLVEAMANPGQKTGFIWVDFTLNYPEVDLLKYEPFGRAALDRKLTAQDLVFQKTAALHYAGCRSSAYGPGDDFDNKFPYTFPSVDSDGWGYVLRNVVKAFPGSRPMTLWAVGGINTDTNECMLEFPKPAADSAN